MLRILHFVFSYEKLTKILQHESKSGFFLSRSHIGRDSGLTSKIGMIPTKSGWLDSLCYKEVLYNLERLWLYKNVAFLKSKRNQSFVLLLS